MVYQNVFFLKIFLVLTLNFKILFSYKIRYIVDDKELDLTPDFYDGSEEVILPKYEKEGYYFIGWFPSKISLYRYEKLEKGKIGNINLYAKFFSITNDHPIKLPESTAKIGGIEKVFYEDMVLLQPYDTKKGSSYWPSYNKMDYEWFSSDESVASINIYSTITPKKNGYTIITGILLKDESKTVNGILYVNGEELTIVDEEEANKLKLVNVTFRGKDDEILETQLMKKGEQLFYPIPKSYKGYGFIGWDKNVTLANENLTIKAQYSDKVINKYEGKKIAVLGDSISTFEGYNPDGYAALYPASYGDIRNIYETWWMKVITTLGGGLFINNSFGGTTASDFGETSACYKERLMTTLIDNDYPDVILVFMGTNDCASKYCNTAKFLSGYSDMIKNMNKIFPETEIILINLPENKYYETNVKDSYNEVISECSEKYHLQLIDISKVNLIGNLIDLVHPNKNGMILLSQEIINALLNNGKDI